jgi:hypothetical protein
LFDVIQLLSNLDSRDECEAVLEDELRVACRRLRIVK